MDKPYIVTVLRPLRKKEANKIVENMVFNELHENYKVALSYEPIRDISKLN